MEKQRGTADEAIAYCKKDGDFVSFGDIVPINGKGQGKGVILIL